MSSSGSISGPSHAASGSQLCSTGTTCSVTGVSITAGQTIIASNWNGNNYTGTCSDNLGTPTVYYNVLSTYKSAFGGGPLVTCWGVATASGTATVTFTNDSTTSMVWVDVYNNVSSVSIFSPFDAKVSNYIASTSSSANAVISTQKTTANSGDLIHGVLLLGGTPTITAGSSPLTFSLNGSALTNSTFQALITEDGLQSSSGATQAAFTVNSGGQKAIVQMLALSAVPASGGTGNLMVYSDFENSTNGTTTTNAILTSGTHDPYSQTGWSGPTGSNAMTVATSCQKNLLTSKTVGVQGSSTTYTDSGSTRGQQFNLASSTSGYFRYTSDRLSNIYTAAGWFYNPVSTGDATDYFSMGGINDGNGDDYVAVMVNNGKMYPETLHNPNGADDVGSFYSYTQNTWYWISLQFVLGPSAYHSMSIYDTSGTLLSTQKKLSVATTLPNQFTLGRGGDNGTPANLWCWDNVVIDTENGGAFPIVP